MFKVCLLSFFLFIAVSAEALLELPHDLNKSDRKQMLRTLGFGTTGKSLSNPYPLGGYSGVDIGMAIEVVPTQDLSTLGSSSSRQYLSEFSYPKIIIGKGLYSNVDVYVHFIPFSESRGISDYGCLVRWAFFEGTFLPATLSLNLHTNSVNISNLFTNQSSGVDLVAGFNADGFSIYAGTGAVIAKGTFIGGDKGITELEPDPATGNMSRPTATEEEYSNHYFVGTTVNFASLYFSFQIDRYVQSIYAVAVGLRF